MLELLTDSIVSVFGNALLFGTVPVVWWLIFHRKKESLGRFMGLYKPEREAGWIMLLGFAVLYIANYLFTEDIMEIFLSEETVRALTDASGTQDDVLQGIGMVGILPAVIANFICNGFFEEFFYRGFLLKRIKKLTRNGAAAAMITAVLFGLMHNALYILAGLSVGFDYHAAIFVYTMLGSLLLGWVNEKLFNGSIWPSIILHGTGNFIGSVFVMFALT